MNEVTSTGEAHAGRESAEPVTATHKILNNPFLLLFLGIAIPTALYIIWGLVALIGTPVGK